MKRVLASDPGHERRARLSVIWQDLVTPVRAIAEYQEIIVEEGRRLGLAELMPYLDKVLAAARMLGGIVDRVRDTRADAESSGTDAIAGLEARLRHDLRTPLNAIIGYSEMVAEDLSGVAEAGSLQSDIAKLLEESRRLLEQIDAIVDLSRSREPTPAARPLEGRPDAGEAAWSALLRTLRPERHPKRSEVGRILVVDDNESSRDLLSRRLGHEGHDVTSAASGREALELVEGVSFDLLLLDLLMPDMNGIELLERLKSDERTRHIPAIMVSGLSETDAVIRCIEAGAEDYLPKPCDLVLLRARIGAALERKRWRERERDYLQQLTSEKERSEALLRSILPDPIVLRLNAGETVIADRFEEVSILFADIVDFTSTAALTTPGRLVERLDGIFREFDSLARALGVEKIKTIGDAYMAAAGLPEARADHVEAIAAFALSILDALKRLAAGQKSMQIRIGIHSGPVVAGIIGGHKFIYDVWGDTVNVASRLESQGVPDRIQVSGPVRDALAHRYRFEPRGTISLKGRGSMSAYLLVDPEG